MCKLQTVSTELTELTKNFFLKKKNVYSKTEKQQPKTGTEVMIFFVILLC